MSANVLGVSLGGTRLPIRRELVALYLPIIALMFLVTLAAYKGHIPVSIMTRDMAAIAKVHPFTGVVTNVGVLLWCAAAAICLFSCSLLRQRGHQPEARFLWWAGLMTVAYLLVHRRLILESSFGLLAAALVLFGSSMMVDVLDGAGWRNLAEDGCKLLGIASWLGYHAGRARHWLVHAPEVRSQM